MKRKITAGIAVVLLSMSISSLGFAATAKSYDYEKTNVSQNKVWTIVFSRAVKESTADDFITVVDDNNKKQDIELDFDSTGTKVYVSPEDDYDRDETYVLTVEKEILSTGDDKMTKDYKLEFKTDEDKKLDLWMSREDKEYDDEDDVTGDAYVKSDNITVKDLDVDGRLYIDIGSDGEVDLDNVTASRLIIVSAKTEGIDIDDCDFDKTVGDLTKIKGNSSEENGDTVLIGKIDDIDINRDEIEIDLFVRDPEGDEDNYNIVIDKDKHESLYDDIKDEDYEEDDIIKIYADKSGKKYKVNSMEMLIEDREFDKYKVFCVIDNDEDEIELGFGEDKDTDSDDYSKHKSVKLDKDKRTAEITHGQSEISEGDFVQVHVNEDGDVDALSLAFINTDFDEDYYSEKSPKGDIFDDAIMRVSEFYERNSKTYLKLESETGHIYTAEATEDAEDLIDDKKIDVGDIIKVEYDDDDEEVTDFDVLIDHDAAVYKVIDEDKDEVELGFDDKPDTDTDDFDSKDKVSLEKSNDYESFGRVNEGDFVVVTLDDNEIETIAVVPKPEKLATRKPDKDGSSSSDDSDKMIVLIKDIDEDDGDFTIKVEDEDEKSYTLEATGDAKRLFDRDKADEGDVIEMEWDNGDDEISDFDVLIEDDDDDVYKVIYMKSRSIELGFDDDPREDIDDFRSSDKDEVDMIRSAEIFGDPEEEDFVKVYIEDDEITVVLKVGRPDELADESPVD